MINGIMPAAKMYIPFRITNWVIHLNISWNCAICNNPNYSTVLHDYNNIETSNISSTNISDIPPHSPDQKPTYTIKPVHTSTPTRNKSPHKCNQPLKTLNINFQSIKSKLCRLSNLINSTRPDIIGSETWLDNDIKSPEICSSGYVVHRKIGTTTLAVEFFLSSKANSQFHYLEHVELQLL